MVGDLGKPQQVRQVLAGVDHLFLVTPASPEQVDWETTAITAAAEVGVGHVVKLSVLGADPDAAILFARQHGDIEKVLADSGMAWTLLRPNGFMQNLLGSGATVAGQGKIFAATGQEGISWVDVRDIAAVAATALTEPGHEGKTYTLTGPQALSYGEVASVLGQVAGKPVEYVPVSSEQSRQSLLQLGVPPWLADRLVELDEQVYAKGYAAVVSPDIEQVTGRPARRFADMAAEHRELFTSAT